MPAEWPAEFDDLSRRLSDLESDVARVRMAGPAVARRRGRQRARNRAAGVALGTVAAIVIGVGALNALPQTTATPEPIDTPTPAPTPEPTQDPTPGPILTPTPDSSPTEESESSPLADLLLAPSDLAALESHWWGDAEWVAHSGRRPGEAGFACFPIFGQPPGGATQSAFANFQADAVERWADEEIWTFASEDEAADALAEFRSSLGLCATEREDVDLTDTWEYDGIGDASFQSAMFVPPEIEGATHVAIVGAARTGSTLVVTATDFGSQEAFLGESDMLAAAVAKVCGDCVGEITQRQTYPESTPDSDLFLLDDDVNPVGTYSDFVRSDTRSDTGRYESFCLPELVFQEAIGQSPSVPAQVGGEAPTIYQAEWFGPSEGTVYETVMQFPDGQEAASFLANYVELPEQCGEVAETREQVVNQPTARDVSGADEALVWTVDEQPLPEDPGSEPGFSGVGMARAGNVVVVIGFAASGDPTSGTSGTWADYAAQTLALAIDRAQG